MIGFEETLRQVGIGIVSFILGMNIYIFFKVTKTKRLVVHKRVASFQKMTLAIQWLYLNQIILFSMIMFSRYQRLINDAPVVWVDYVAIPIFISYLLFNIYLIKHYIISALNGKLFSKDGISKIHMD